jgi:hypothetical protein
MSKLSAWLAIAVAGPLFIVQIVRNYDNLGRWPMWGVDLLVAVILAVAGAYALRGARPKYLASAWSFSAAMYLSGFAMRVGYNGPGADPKLTLIIAGLLAVSVVGAAMVLLSGRPAQTA